MKLTVRSAETTYDASVAVEGKALSNRTARSGTTIQGWPAVIVGLIVIAVGAGLAALVMGVIAPGATRTGDFPRWIIALMGGLFAFAGLSVTLHGIKGIVRMARVRRLRAGNPNEPWWWDHPWDTRVAYDDTTDRARHFFVAAMFVFLFLTPFHWIGFFGPKSGIPFGIVALLFDAIAIGLLAAAGYFVLRRFKYGRSVALFGVFPFRRGSTLELHVTAPRALPQHAVPTATLRCIQERYVTTGTGEDKRMTVECREIYRDTAQADLITAAAGERALRVRFTVPADAPTTDLASRPCRYWEVDVEAVTDGVDYGARFLVPVY
jgi:hypothetical protein